MKNKYLYIVIICISAAAFFTPQHTDAQTMADYTAYPPFVTSAIAPNILLVLDHSGSMQFPAYTGCTFGGYSSQSALCGDTDSIQSPDNIYELSWDYYGYFEKNKYYEYNTSKFVETSTCSYGPADPEYRIGNTTGTCISGNLLNWATMSRIDLLRKVLIGGKSIATTGTTHTLRAEGGRRKFSDHNLGCTFDLTGGTYPDLDHQISISNYGMTGTCGYLTTWASGSYVWGTSDEFRYVYQPINGDFDVKLRIVSPPSESGQTYAKAGLMVRASTAADSQHVMVNATYGAGLQFAYRSAAGGGTATFANYVSSTYPEWVRIVRTGDTFDAYYSDDGTTWTYQGSIVVSMPAGALIGMSTASYSSSTLASGEFDEFICDVCSSDNFNDYTFDTSIWTGIDINTAIAGTQIESCGGSCMVGNLSSANTQVDVPEKERRGIIQNLSDKDRDGVWDANSPRFGLMVYANDGREGEMRAGIDGSTMSSLLTALQDEPPYHGTPTGEALREAYDYFTQIDNYPEYETNSGYMDGPGTTTDPFYENGTAISCRKNFVLLISDGEWNGSVDPVVPATVSHVNDIRADIADEQNIYTYAVYTFGDAAGGRNSLQQTAMFGSFDDFDGDKWPYNRGDYPGDSRTVTLPAAPCDPLSPPMDNSCKEWDKKGDAGSPDGIPDTYYEATDGNKLEGKLLTAISDMLQQSSSGTAVSVLATTGEGEGAIYQAYFYPEKVENVEIRKWLGFMHALFVDSYGNIREDTDGDAVLDLGIDRIIEMEYSAKFGAQANLFTDTDKNGVKDSTTPVSTVQINKINSIWRSGERLWLRNPDPLLTAPYPRRMIYASTTGLDMTELIPANAAVFEPYLRAADTAEAENIINWVRGYDFTNSETGVDFLPYTVDAGHPEGYRQRSITPDGEIQTRVWKLGDIIYSTPSVVGQPMENYDMLYKDITYYSFLKQYRDRRHTVYVGANDGMLHAFNGGFFSDKKHAYCTGAPDGNGDCTTGVYALGDELWAFIPRGLLPHLKWLTDPDYTHVYFVDLKPKITDVKVFSPGTTHTEGWGTILIGGYRYGGKGISWTAGVTNYSASPEYFALDITDPLNPQLLWTFSDPDLGLSMSYPAVAKVGDTWFAIFGSGPTNYDQGSNLTSFQSGNLFVLKISGGADGVINSWIQDSNYWKIPTGNITAFLANPITVDVDMDYNVDVIYVGENYDEAGIMNALLRRITTNNGTSTTADSWVLSTVGNINDIAGAKDKARMITAAPSAALDDQMNLWTYFGTGAFYGTSDKNQTDTGAFYGIKDKCWKGTCSTSYTDLMDVSGAAVKTDDTVTGVTTCAGAGSADIWSNLVISANICDGWALYFDTIGETTDFLDNTLNHAGERVFSKPLVVGGLVAIGSYIPGDSACSFLGESNAYALYYKTGTAFDSYVFNEQKGQTSPSDVVARTVNLGEGMPSSPSGHRTESGTAQVFFQQSTGTIITAEQKTPISIKSALKGWKNEMLP